MTAVGTDDVDGASESSLFETFFLPLLLLLDEDEGGGGGGGEEEKTSFSLIPLDGEKPSFRERE